MLPGKIGAPLRGAINVRQRKKGQPEVRAVLPQLRKPSTPFNKTITANRAFAFSDLPLADFKAVGKAFDVTLNDVVVSVCAGVLRRYLQSRGPVPKEPLVVCIPYSLRTGEEAQRWANHISMFFAPPHQHRRPAGAAQHGPQRSAGGPRELRRTAQGALPRGKPIHSAGLLRRASEFAEQGAGLDLRLHLERRCL